ncbi:Uncharacterised protein [Vibrio cholerae]|nr:Uncharacterised protein [Vibrio cholerae]
MWRITSITFRYRQTEFCKQLFSLIFMQIHCVVPFVYCSSIESIELNFTFVGSLLSE